MSTASVLLLSLQLWGAIVALQGCGGGGDGGGGGDAPAAEAGTPGPDCKGGSPGDNIAENQDKWHADCGPDEVRADLAPTGGCECITETPAFLYNEDGSYVKEAHKLYGKYCLSWEADGSTWCSEWAGQDPASNPLCNADSWCFLAKPDDCALDDVKIIADGAWLEYGWDGKYSFKNCAAA